MTKTVLTEEEAAILVRAVLEEFSDYVIGDDSVFRCVSVFQEKSKEIMEARNKPVDPYPYLISEPELRTMFEEQHQGRDLRRGRRGTYQSVQIAAIWNQHLRSARAIEQLLRQKLQGNVCV